VTISSRLRVSFYLPLWFATVQIAEGLLRLSFNCCLAIYPLLFDPSTPSSHIPVSRNVLILSGGNYTHLVVIRQEISAGLTDQIPCLIKLDLIG
jgi:hypothetical protein